MNFPRRRSMIHVPLDQWPAIDGSVLQPGISEQLARRSRAMKLYAEGYSHVEIFADTGISKQQLSHFFKRCQTIAHDGLILGYRALVPHVRTDAYKRTAPIRHIVGDSGAGCSGALGLLLARFPELESYIVEEFLRRPKHKHDEARISLVRLHAKILTWLDGQGLTKDEWPFNTKSEGLQTFRRYCHDLISSHEQRFLAARAGKDAVMRSSIGKGVAPLFRGNRPFTSVQLDFHKVDASSIITITNSHGVDIDVPLARWHIGVMIEECTTLVLGAVIALEITPSSDSVLETVECALAPLVDKPTRIALAIGLGDKVFPNQQLEELVGQGFCILKMDNGWSNIASNVLRNMMDIVGCAVNLGPAREWWNRHQIEKMFGQMTRAALQSAPSTYGSGPHDTKRNNPSKSAVKLQIRLTDLVHAIEGVVLSHNETRTDALQMGAPIQTVRAALNNHDSLHIPAYLPGGSSSADHFPLVCYTTVRATIRGNAKKGERPYVKIGGWRYTNARIASDFTLIGTEIIARCSLRDARIVYATHCETGELLGKLKAPSGKADTAVTFRMRSLIHNAGSAMKQRERREREAAGWSGISLGKTTGTTKPTPSEALRHANAEISRPSSEAPPGAPSVPHTPISRPGGFFNVDALADIPRNK